MVTMASVVAGMRWSDSEGVGRHRGREREEVRSEDGQGKGSVKTCSALKTAYHDCFNRWYSEKFVKGQWEKEECMVEWEAYYACVSKKMGERNMSHLLQQDPRPHPSGGSSNN